MKPWAWSSEALPRVWYTDRALAALRVSMRLWYFDNGENWLRDNMPTLARYL